MFATCGVGAKRATVRTHRKTTDQTRHCIRKRRERQPGTTYGRYRQDCSQSSLSQIYVTAPNADESAPMQVAISTSLITTVNAAPPPRRVGGTPTGSGERTAIYGANMLGSSTENRAPSARSSPPRRPGRTTRPTARQLRLLHKQMAIPPRKAWDVEDDAGEHGAGGG